ncbi:hypothetical protein, partial [Mycobacterium szulgai]|uniref:hypothetical protein n=1 Tax=Mycobacterium szulgai TaxID=1787 RepID=UPI0021F2AA5E
MFQVNQYRVKYVRNLVSTGALSHAALARMCDENLGHRPYVLLSKITLTDQPINRSTDQPINR